MQLSTFTLAMLATAASAAEPFSTWMTDSYLDRNIPLGKDMAGQPFITYEHGVFGRALQMVYNTTGEAKYYNALKTAMDNIVSPTGALLDFNLTYYTLDDIRVGPELLYLWLKTGDTRYKKAAGELRSQIQTNPRNPEGGFWHRSTYPNQMWLDGLYMVEPFYAQYTQLFQPKNATAWADIVKQFDLVEKNTRNATTGLLAHGYDSSFTAKWAHPPRGVSPEVWDRALGWYTMALVDVLDYFPKSHAGYKTLSAYFVRVMAAVKKAQDAASGGWWLVMSQPGREGNYIESSASAMFVYSALKGIRKGFLKKNDYFGMAEKGYKLLSSDRFTRDVGNGTLEFDGTVEVGSLRDNGDYPYYISVPLRMNDLKGLGPFIFASVEYEAAT